jgi:hypothetical protein
VGGDGGGAGMGILRPRLYPKPDVGERWWKCQGLSVVL